MKLYLVRQHLRLRSSAGSFLQWSRFLDAD